MHAHAHAHAYVHVTRQVTLLDAAYPLLRDAALFFEGQLRPAGAEANEANGTLRFGVPAHSPENSYVSAEQATPHMRTSWWIALRTAPRPWPCLP